MTLFSSVGVRQNGLPFVTCTCPCRLHRLGAHSTLRAAPKRNLGSRRRRRLCLCLRCGGTSSDDLNQRCIVQAAGYRHATLVLLLLLLQILCDLLALANQFAVALIELGNFVPETVRQIRSRGRGSERRRSIEYTMSRPIKLKASARFVLFCCVLIILFRRKRATHNHYAVSAASMVAPASRRSRSRSLPMPS